VSYCAGPSLSFEVRLLFNFYLLFKMEDVVDVEEVHFSPKIKLTEGINVG
jgi:hypothetical protein